MFLAAIALFIGLFNQTIQTAIVYQQHNALATKTSDFLDNILLGSGTPSDWSEKNISDDSPTGFGLQDRDFDQYQLDPFSLMRLQSSGPPLYYNMDGQNITYSNINMGFGQYLLVPYSEVLNYSHVSRLLGVNGSYGLSLTVVPTVNVTISEMQSQPLTLSLNVSGPGFPLVGAKVTYCLITVTGRDSNNPVYRIDYGNTSTNAAGSATIYEDVDVTQKSYAVIVSASLFGMSGMGYYSNSLWNSTYVVPLVKNFQTHTINLAHSWGIGHVGDTADIYYNVTFLRAMDMTEMMLNNGTGGTGVYGRLSSQSHDTLVLDSNNLGVLVIAYNLNSSASGIVAMPWGFSSLGFSVTFGADPMEQDWVSTDVRQVRINNVPYQAKLSLWSIQGRQVIT
jgi:hypothetical protein